MRMSSKNFCLDLESAVIMGGRPMATLVPSLTYSNSLLIFCDISANENHIELGSSITVVLLLTLTHFLLEIRPNLHLCQSVLPIIEQCKYVGLLLATDITEVKDIDREKRNLAMRRNCLIFKFYYCTDTAKCHSLWDTAAKSRLFLPRLSREK